MISLLFLAMLLPAGHHGHRVHHKQPSYDGWVHHYEAGKEQGINDKVFPGWEGPVHTDIIHYSGCEKKGDSLWPPVLNYKDSVKAESYLLVVDGTPGPDSKVRVSSSDGSRVERLSDEEYDRLKKARQAVIDTEREIGKAHGVQMEMETTLPLEWHSFQGGMYVPSRKADHYEYHGQFLFVSPAK